jgi:hypothetical protein
MMIAVAVIGVCCYLAERLIHSFEDTVYAEGYSEQRFSTISNGMSTNQVETIIGAPISKNSWIDGGDVELWRYTESPSDGDYWRRWVFFRNGKVYRIDSRFWVD